MRIRVTVPASAGNTGPGFDSLGLAYGLYNEVILDTTRSGPVEIDGEGEARLRDGETNLVLEAMRRFREETGRTLPQCGLRLVNRIPFCRGLGSSGAAIVAGLLAADALAGTRMSREELLRLALLMEDHPDNVSAALFGGAVLTVFEDGVDSPFTVVPIQIPAGWRAVVLVPEREIRTSDARAVLPRTVPREDAIFNHRRVGLLVAAFLRRQPEHLRRAMQDRVHQPYRAKLFPEMDDLIQAAVDGGAWGACLSGAGPAILALTARETAPAVARAMEAAAAERNVDARVEVLKIPRAGARVVTR